MTTISPGQTKEGNCPVNESDWGECIVESVYVPTVGPIPLLFNNTLLRRIAIHWLPPERQPSVSHLYSFHVLP